MCQECISDIVKDEAVRSNNIVVEVCSEIMNVKGFVGAVDFQPPTVPHNTR
jgi:hypothetical protein